MRDSNLALTYASWKRQLDVYLLVSVYTEKPPKIRRAIILSVGGPRWSVSTSIHMTAQLKWLMTTNQSRSYYRSH